VRTNTKRVFCFIYTFLIKINLRCVFSDRIHGNSNRQPTGT
jgi:hypothetical protein